MSISHSPPKANDAVIDAALVNAPLQAGTQAAMAASVVTAVAGGPGSASDIQAMILIMMARCVPSNAAATTSGGYKLMTPFAISDTAGGALAGNAAACGALLAVQLVMIAVFRFKDRSSSGDIADACGATRFPGYILLLFASLFQGTLFVSLRLVSSSSSDGGETAAGVISLASCLLFPAAIYVAALKVRRRFVAYEIDQSPQFANRWFTQLLPVGTIEPATTRQMLSSVIAGYRHANPLCTLLPVASALIVNTISVLPASVPGWVCQGLLYASVAAHLALASVVIWFRISRVFSSSVMSACGLLLIAVFHLQTAAGWRGGLSSVFSLQLALSFLRSCAALTMMVVEYKMKKDPQVLCAKVVWCVGSQSAARPLNRTGSLDDKVGCDDDPLASDVELDAFPSTLSNRSISEGPSIVGPLQQPLMVAEGEIDDDDDFFLMEPTAKVTFNEESDGVTDMFAKYLAASKEREGSSTEGTLGAQAAGVLNPFASASKQYQDVETSLSLRKQLDIGNDCIL